MRQVFAAGGGLPASIADLYASADPAQDIIDLMSYATLPDYLWLGDETDGAWVDVVSSLSMAKVNTPLFEQAESAFGGADSIGFDANSDGFADSVNDGSLDIGTGDFQALVICKPTTQTTSAIFSKQGSTYGYRNYMTSTGHMAFQIKGVSATVTGTVAVDHGTTNAQTILCKRDSGGTNIYTREGSAGSATATGNGDADGSTAFKFGLGSGLNAFQGNLAMIAIWIGTGTLTDTERAALATGLGLE